MSRTKFHPKLAVLALSICSSAAYAAWPEDKPIEIVVPYEAGGENDVVTRALVPYISKHLPKSSFVVVNRPGASGEIGTSYVQRAKADGYVFGIAAVPPLVFVPLTKKTAYDVTKIRLVARTMHDPTVLVGRTDSPVTSLNGLAEKIKADGRPISISNMGTGSHSHLATLLMQKALNTEVISVPFNGNRPSKTAFMGGHIDMMMTTQSGVTSDTSGTMKPLVQFTRERSPQLAGVPTAREQGVDIEMDVDRGFIAPSGIPPEILSRFEAAVKAAVKDPAFLKATPAFAPLMDFASGAQWQAIVEKRMPSLREMAKNMPKE